MSQKLLQMHLSCCVPLAIDDLQRRGGPLEPDWESAREFAVVLGSQGDQILYRSKETAKLVSQLVRVMAVMAFAPGGIRFGGMMWCADHYPMGLDSKDLCPECR